MSLIKNTLFDFLKEKNRKAKINKNYLLQFQSGLDYLEATIKFFGVFNIALAKSLNINLYKDIFFNNFKLSPSLGDYKSLAIVPFSKKNSDIFKKDNDELYNIILSLFYETDLKIELFSISNILDNNLDGRKNQIKNLWELFDTYVVNFRNKFKGHGATFNEEDTEQQEILIDTLDKILTFIEIKINKLFSIDDLSFEASFDNSENIEEHTLFSIIAKYKNKNYELSPLMIYLHCNKYSCKNNHKQKIFFYNENKSSKVYYLDYLFNHFYFSSTNNKIKNTLKEMAILQNEIIIHSSSDNNRQNTLISTFVGREAELTESKKHLENCINKKIASIITVKGKPGIGKSAFISKLFEVLKSDIKEIQTYIFYVRKSEMGNEEEKYFFNKLLAYLEKIGINTSSLINKRNLTFREKMENLFEFLDSSLKKPLLLAIDGLDEFNNPLSFLENFPMQKVPNMLHLIFSTRDYSNILDKLQEKIFNSSLEIYNKEYYIYYSCSIVISKLLKEDVELLINEVLTKDINRDSNEYKLIQNQIYEKSEGLALYVQYISNNLMEYDFNDIDIPNTILNYAKELPQGLNNFYFQTFKNLGSIHSEILYLLYFAAEAINFDSFYNLIISSNYYIDKKDFQSNYFSQIEIFLNKDENNKYSFYHLSIKEAIKNFFMQDNNLLSIVEVDYDVFSQTILIAPNQVEQYKILFNEFYYLKTNSDMFLFLEKVIGFLKDKKNDKKFEEFFEENYLTYFYRYIWFKIFAETISFENIQNKKYESFNDFNIQDIKELIKEFFNVYDNGYKTNIKEIKYAHEFALLLNDYKRILLYSKDYNNKLIEEFMKIIWNLDNPKNQILFKKSKLMLNDISDEIKIILLYNSKIIRNTKVSLIILKTINNEKYENDCFEILKLLSFEINNYSDLLEIVDLIEEEWKKKEFFKEFLLKSKSKELIDLVIKNNLSNYDEYYYNDIDILYNKLNNSNLTIDQFEKELKFSENAYPRIYLKVLMLIIDKFKEIPTYINEHKISSFYQRLCCESKIATNYDDLFKVINYYIDNENESDKELHLQNIFQNIEEEEIAFKIYNDIISLDFMKENDFLNIITTFEIYLKYFKVINNTVYNEKYKYFFLKALCFNQGVVVFNEIINELKSIKNQKLKSDVAATIITLLNEEKKILEFIYLIEDKISLARIYIRLFEITNNNKYFNKMNEMLLEIKDNNKLCIIFKDFRDINFIESWFLKNCKNLSIDVYSLLFEKTNKFKYFLKFLFHFNNIRNDCLSHGILVRKDLMLKFILFIGKIKLTKRIQKYLLSLNILEFEIINSKKNLEIATFNNLFYNLNKSKIFYLKDSFRYVGLKDYRTIINFYNKIEKQENEIDILTNELLNLKRQKEIKEAEEDEIAYNEIIYQANIIKDRILKDEILLNSFLIKYQISHFKFKNTGLLEII